MHKAWERCLELAVQGIAAGSLGISAVIMNHEGKIISTGRNQLFDREDSCNSIRANLVSHAEINALAGLPENEQESKDLCLFTTVEPCPMCMGAIALSKVRHINIASKDAYAGSTELTKHSSYISRKSFRIDFAEKTIERLFAVLHFLSIRLNNRRVTQGHPFGKSFQKHYPEYYDMALLLAEKQELRDAIRTENLKTIRGIILSGRELN